MINKYRKTSAKILFIIFSFLFYTKKFLQFKDSAGHATYSA